MSDLFECFGSDDTDESDDACNGHLKSSNRILLRTSDEDEKRSLVRRHDTCGVLSFHRNTEKALLLNVRNYLDETQHDGVKTDPASDLVLKCVDRFCMERHWMMHVGPEKGRVLIGALNDAIENYVRKYCFIGNPCPKPSTIPLQFNVAELGTYCGYASVLLGAVLRNYSDAYPNIDFHLYSLEIQPEFIEVSKEMIHLSNLDDIVTIIQVEWNVGASCSYDVASVLQEAIHKKTGSSSPAIHFLFIDHDKDCYADDLIKIEASLLREGSTVAADNVIFARIDNYLQYMQAQQCKGIVKTKTIMSRVEYSNDDGNFSDGLEVTTYLRDPVVQ